jgi:NodT family efflux transporter outer membrane factor (OMF) lipoprotein
MFYRLLPILFLLSACSFLSDLDKKEELRDDLKSYKAEKRDDFKSVYGNWWEKYNDVQLNKLIHQSFETSPDLSEAFTRIEKANANVISSFGHLLPSLNLQGSYQGYKAGAGMYPSTFASTFSQNIQQFPSLQLNTSYELDIWQKNSKALASAVLQMEVGKLNFDQAKLLLTVSIVDLYATLNEVYQQLDVSKEALDVRTKTRDLFAKRFKEGLENESSLEQSESSLKIAEADIAEITSQIEIIKQKISLLIGKMPDYSKEIQRPQSHKYILEHIPSKIPSHLIARRLDIMMAKLLVESNAKRIDVAKAGQYPTINLIGSIGTQSLGTDTFFKSTSMGYSFGPSVYLPIFNKAGIEGAYRNAIADYNTSVSQYESSILTALNDVSAVIESHKTLIIKIEKIEEALKASEKAYNVAKERYKGGLSTYLEVLRAEDTLLMVKKTLTSLKAQTIHLDIKLIKALGGAYKFGKGDRS